MSTNEKPMSLNERLETIDLSYFSQSEIIRMQAEAVRAEYIAGLIATACRKAAKLFSSAKSATISAPGLRQA